jgi:membrane protein DedA with SNARE-associated domain
VALATLGGFIGDQALFFIGRHYGHRIVERFPRFAQGTERVTTLIDRHPDAAVLAVRFLYGLRIAGPVAMGISRVHWLRFAVLNFASASAWGALFVALGYALGQAAERLLGRIERVEEWALAGLVTAAVAVFLIRHARRRRTTNRGSC